MEQYHLAPRVVAFSLCLALGLPNQAWALRSIQSRQNPEMVQTLTAGLEEPEVLMKELYETVNRAIQEAQSRDPSVGQYNYSPISFEGAVHLIRDLQKRGELGPTRSFVELAGPGIVATLAQALTGATVTAVDKDRKLLEVVEAQVRSFVLEHPGVLDLSKMEWVHQDLKRPWARLSEFDVLYLLPPLIQAEWLFTPFSFIYEARPGALLVVVGGAVDLGADGRPMVLPGSVETVPLDGQITGYRRTIPAAGMEELAPLVAEAYGVIRSFIGKYQRNKQGQLDRLIQKEGDGPGRGEEAFNFLATKILSAVPAERKRSLDFRSDFALLSIAIPDFSSPGSNHILWTFAGLEERIPLAAGVAAKKAIFITPEMARPQLFESLKTFKPAPGEQLPLVIFGEHELHVEEIQGWLNQTGLRALEIVNVKRQLEGHKDWSLFDVVAAKQAEYHLGTGADIHTIWFFEDLKSLGRFLGVAPIHIQLWEKSLERQFGTQA